MAQDYANPVRIALWSGPRNLSTAMMRSFGARRDTICADEPFYAPYLAITGLNHPMRDAILQAHENDPKKVAHSMAYTPAPAPIFYQKHMCHHMVPEIDRDWMGQMRNAFLIRHPAKVLASYANKMEDVSLEAIGFVQQAQLFDHVTNNLGQPAIVVDSDDILRDPPAMLAALCDALGIEYTNEMLSWQEGYQPQDGIWASHWYNAVIASTGFASPKKGADLTPPDLPKDYANIAEQALPLYNHMRQFAMKAA
jgi:hypothetical protein